MMVTGELGVPMGDFELSLGMQFRKSARSVEANNNGIIIMSSR